MFRFRSWMADRRVRVVMQFEQKLQSCRVTCRACGRVVIYPPTLAVAAFGGITLVSDLERRLRCGHCEAKRAEVSGVYREWRW